MEVEQDTEKGPHHQVLAVEKRKGIKFIEFLTLSKICLDCEILNPFSVVLSILIVIYPPACKIIST